MPDETISIIIPTLNAGPSLKTLLAKLADQTRAADEILVIDSASDDDTAAVAADAGCRVVRIDRADFNHGRTRNEAAAAARGDVLVFMTQDVEPADERFLEALTAPIRDKAAAAAYARQIAAPVAQPLEAFTREANYPPRSRRRTLADLPELGVKTFFLSNAAAAYDRAAWEAAGRFDPTVIMNEDMLMCARLLRQGRTIAYQSDARVYHTHNYGLSQQFRRYFDIGVFFRQAGAELAGASAGGAGLRFAVGQITYLARRGAWGWIPRACAEIALKFIAVHLGKRHRLLPGSWRRRFSLHRGFWPDR